MLWQKTSMTQSEEILEQGLIKTLTEMSYEYVSIKEEENLLANFKVQLEKHNQKELAAHGREHFTDKEFDKILLYLDHPHQRSTTGTDRTEETRCRTETGI